MIETDRLYLSNQKQGDPQMTRMNTDLRPFGQKTF